MDAVTEGTLAARRRRGHPLRGPQGRPGHARDARRHRRHQGRRPGQGRAAAHRRPVLRRHDRACASATSRPRPPTAARSRSSATATGSGSTSPPAPSTCWSTRPSWPRRARAGQPPPPRYTSGVLGQVRQAGRLRPRAGRRLRLTAATGSSRMVRRASRLLDGGRSRCDRSSMRTRHRRTRGARRLRSSQRAAPPSPSGPRGFLSWTSPRTDAPLSSTTEQEEEPDERADHRSPGPGRGPGAGRRRGRLRHPRRRDPARLRPAVRLHQVRHILVRHEQGAGHAAEGYAAATGRVGVCMATSGPGATNLVTPIADAYMDSVPMVAITGQVAERRDRHRRLPGGGHPRHHHADHQAQLPRHRPRGDPAARSPRRSTSPAPAGPARSWSTSPRTRCRRRPTFAWPASAGPARLPPGDPPARQAGPRGRAADRSRPRRPVLYVGGGVLKAPARRGAAGRSPS